MRFSYNHKQILLAAFAIAVSSIGLYTLIGILFKGHVTTFWVLPIIGAIVFLGLLIPFAKDYMDGFRIGDDGEKCINRFLSNNLPATYYCLHDIVLPESKGNIDEAVVSPFGIWTLEVKNSKSGGVYWIQKAGHKSTRT